MVHDKHYYAEEKLAQAADSLIVGMGPIRSRLANAAIYIIRLSAEHFPDKSSANTHEHIRHDLTWRAAGPDDDGTIEATTKNLSDEDAERIARCIFELYMKIRDRNRAEGEG